VKNTGNKYFTYLLVKLNRVPVLPNPYSPSPNPSSPLVHGRGAREISERTGGTLLNQTIQTVWIQTDKQVAPICRTTNCTGAHFYGLICFAIMKKKYINISTSHQFCASTILMQAFLEGLHECHMPDLDKADWEPLLYEELILLQAELAFDEEA